MKFLKKLFILMLIVSIIATGCTNTSKNTIAKDNDILKEEPIELPKENIEVKKEPMETKLEPTSEIIPKVVDPFLERFSPDVTAADIGIYIRDNIANASKDEADKMIEWLLMYQDEAQSNFNTRIWEDEYMNVLINDMDGELDKSKVKNIKDEDIKNDYITLVNSFLTIRTYDENPNVETNWVDLIQYSSYLSDDFREIVKLNKKTNYYEYDYEGLDVEGLSKDIIILEEIAKNNKSTFIKWKASDLCRELIYHLLLGPEGGYLFYYDGKGSKEYHSIMELRSKYPNSILKGIIEDLDLIDEEDIWGAIDIIEEAFQFGLYSDKD